MARSSQHRDRSDDTASELKDLATDQFKKVADRVEDVAGAAADQMCEVRDRAGEVAGNFKSAVGKSVEDQPLAMAAGRGRTEDAAPSDEKEDSRESQVPIILRLQLPDDWQMPYPVLCIGNRSALDEAACLMLASHSLMWRRQERAPRCRGRPVGLLSYFGAVSKPAHVRYPIRGLKRLMPHARFLTAFWMLDDASDKVEEWRKAAEADLACSSLADATALCVREAMQAATTGAGVSDARPEEELAAPMA